MRARQRGSAAVRAAAAGWPGRRRRLADADLSRADRILRTVLLVGTAVPALVLLFITAEMVLSALPALIYAGGDFFTHQLFTFGNLYATGQSVAHGVRAPLGASYGAAPFIIGTIASSAVALVIAVPVSVGAVLALVELVPRPVQPALSVFLELLAGIPSVAYGFWGVLYFGPAMAQHLYPVLTRLGVVLPFMRGPVGAGEGLLTTGFILAVMIIPIIASTTRELVRTVPALAREGALALGMTRYETLRAVTLPYIRSGILAASILGWARAIGETMAVLMISGDLLNTLPANIYSPFSSIAATIVDLLDSALTDPTGMAVHALAAIGVVLLVISLASNLVGRLLIRRVALGALPVGRGI